MSALRTSLLLAASFAACTRPQHRDEAAKVAAVQSTSTPAPSASVANPASSACRPACVHAVEVQLALVDKAAYPNADHLRAQREQYVASCQTHCADFDVACALRTNDAIGFITDCTPKTKPVYLNELVGDVYPLTDYLTAPREPKKVVLLGYARAPVVDLPRGMQTRFDDPYVWEARGDWMSPLRFRFTKQQPLSLEGLRQLHGSSDIEIASSNANGTLSIGTVREDGREASTLAFLPIPAHGEGVLCAATATRAGGFADVKAIVRFLDEVCRSFRFAE